MKSESNDIGRMQRYSRSRKLHSPTTMQQYLIKNTTIKTQETIKNRKKYNKNQENPNKTLTKSKTTTQIAKKKIIQCQIKKGNRVIFEFQLSTTRTENMAERSGGLPKRAQETNSQWRSFVWGKQRVVMVWNGSATEAGTMATW